jgi:hypothetical protein
MFESELGKPHHKGKMTHDSMGHIEKCVSFCPGQTGKMTNEFITADGKITHVGLCHFAHIHVGPMSFYPTHSIK